MRRDDALARMSGFDPLQTLGVAGRTPGMVPDKVGLRFTVLPQHEREVTELYRAAGFTPLKVEKQDDGCVTFVFGRQPADRMVRLIASVPPHYSANQGTMGLPPNRGN